MPELPDIEVFTRNLHKIFAGKKLTQIKVVNGKKLPDSPAALTKRLKGQGLKKYTARAKKCVLNLQMVPCLVSTSC